jgi:hypothetical protein
MGILKLLTSSIFVNWMIESRLCCAIGACRYHLFLRLQRIKEWQDMIYGITRDQIELWETWHDVGCGETVREISGKE